MELGGLGFIGGFRKVFSGLVLEGEGAGALGFERLRTWELWGGLGLVRLVGLRGLAFMVPDQPVRGFRV